jgi:hypothetical protein
VNLSLPFFRDAVTAREYPDDKVRALTLFAASDPFAVDADSELPLPAASTYPIISTRRMDDFTTIWSF